MRFLSTWPLLCRSLSFRSLTDAKIHGTCPWHGFQSNVSALRQGFQETASSKCHEMGRPPPGVITFPEYSGSALFRGGRPLIPRRVEGYLKVSASHTALSAFAAGPVAPSSMNVLSVGRSIPLSAACCFIRYHYA